MSAPTCRNRTLAHGPGGANAVGLARTSQGSLQVPTRALRLVLVLALDRPAVEGCLGLPAGCDSVLWPSTLYAWAAETAVRSSGAWRRCAEALDLALAPGLTAYGTASVAEIADLLRAEGEVLSGCEIAAALWALLRQRDPQLAPVIERLAVEAEVRVARAA